MTFPERITAARKALDTAIRNSTPFPDHMMAELRAKWPERVAQAEAEMDVIRATIPALRAEWEALYAQACHRCNGDGLYGGATGYRRNGVPFCFACGGDGRDAKTRRAAAGK